MKKQTSTKTNLSEDEVWMELDETWESLSSRYALGEIDLAQFLLMLSSAVNHLAKNL